MTSMTGIERIPKTSPIYTHVAICCINRYTRHTRHEAIERVPW